MLLLHIHNNSLNVAVLPQSFQKERLSLSGNRNAVFCSQMDIKSSCKEIKQKRNMSLWIKEKDPLSAKFFISFSQIT